MLQFDQVKNKLQELPYDDLVAIHNDCYDDNHIYYTDEMDELLSGSTATEIANMISFGSYNPWHKWFIFDGYGNIKSLFSPLDEIDLDELAADIIDKPELHHYLL